MDLMALSAKISLDASEFEEGLQDAEESMKKASGSIAGEGKKVETTTKGIFSGIMKGAIERVGMKLTDFALSVPGKIKDAFSTALNLAGELEQNVGGAQAVFGDYFDELQTVASRAYEEVGLSQSKYLQNANKIGSLLQGSGFSQKESLEMTVDWMHRASDVASIMGLSVEDAMNAVSGAAKGNFTMMDNLGVAINETTLKTYAATKGMSKAAIDSMSTQQKVSLAYELFMNQTEQYAGNYLKENKTMAGAINTFQMAWEDFLAGVGDGEAVANAGEAALQAIWDTAKELAPKLLKGVQNFVKKAWPKIKKFAKGATNDLIHLINDAFGTDIPDVEVIIKWVQQFWSDVTAAFDTAKEWVNKAFPVMVNFVLGTWVRLQRAFNDADGWINKAFPVMVNFVLGTWTRLQNAFNDANSWVNKAFPVMVNFILGTWTRLQNAFSDASDWINKAFPVMVNFILGTWTRLQNAFNDANDWINRAFPVMINFILGTWTRLQNAFNDANDWINKAFPVMINFILGTWTRLQNAFNDAGKWAGQIFQATINFVLGTWTRLQNAFNDANNWINKAFPVMINFVLGTWTRLQNAFAEAGNWANKIFQSTVNFVLGTWVRLQNAFTLAGEWAGQTFRTTVNFVRGTWRGLEIAFDYAKNWADKAFKTTINFVRGTWQGLQIAFDYAKEWIDQKFQTTVNFVRGTWQGLQIAFDEAGKWVGKRLRVVINWAQERWQSLSGRIDEIKKWVGDKAQEIKLAWTSTIDTWIRTIKGWIDGTGITKVTIQIGATVSGWIKKISKWIEEGINVIVNFFSGGVTAPGGGSTTPSAYGQDPTSEETGSTPWWVGMPSFFAHAKGLNYVPYDGYRATLHRGEQVLTASQARHRNSGSGAGVLAAMVGDLKSTLEHLRIQVGEKEFGSTVADYGSARVRQHINGFNRKRRMGYGSI